MARRRARRASAPAGERRPRDGLYLVGVHDQIGAIDPPPPPAIQRVAPGKTMRFTFSVADPFGDAVVGTAVLRRVEIEQGVSASFPTTPSRSARRLRLTAIANSDGTLRIAAIAPLAAGSCYSVFIEFNEGTTQPIFIPGPRLGAVGRRRLQIASVTRACAEAYYWPT